jgi:ubiquinone/menaquinone biosynthesis C-methylase UbiE
VLDIGVGGGRTTLHLAKKAKAYVGVDYSSEMIDACQKRFEQSCTNAEFRVCDVRDLTEFVDGEFDFTLFSFNGIDAIPRLDRMKAFSEIRRVTRPGGYFAFSTHNIRAAHLSERLEVTRCFLGSPKNIARNLKAWVRTVFFWNSPACLLRKVKRWMVFNDGAHGNRLQQLYIRPEFQWQELLRLFESVSVFRLDTGRELTDMKMVDTIQDAWVYFLCRG